MASCLLNSTSPTTFHVWGYLALLQECGDGCFDPAISRCCDEGAIVGLDECCPSQTVCPADGECYNPDTSTCCSGGVENAECCEGEQLCGGICCGFQCCNDQTCFEFTSTRQVQQHSQYWYSARNRIFGYGLYIMYIHTYILHPPVVTDEHQPRLTSWSRKV